MNDEDAQFLWLVAEARRLCLTVEPCPRCQDKKKLWMLNVPVFVSNPVGLGRYTLLGTAMRTELCVQCRGCKLIGGQRERAYEAIVAWNATAKNIRSFDEQIARLFRPSRLLERLPE